MSKESKALEIIKTKRVMVIYLIWLIEEYKDNALDKYNCATPTRAGELTQEEFELLKEVLL